MTPTRFKKYKKEVQEIIPYLFGSEYNVIPCDIEHFFQEENPILMVEMKNGYPITAMISGENHKTQFKQLIWNLTKPSS